MPLLAGSTLQTDNRETGSGCEVTTMEQDSVCGHLTHYSIDLVALDEVGCYSEQPQARTLGSVTVATSEGPAAKPPCLHSGVSTIAPKAQLRAVVFRTCPSQKASVGLAPSSGPV